MADPATYRPAPGTIPVDPGVYKFRDSFGQVIYVGKAKSLRSRLNSYFADIAALHPRTRQMVTTAASVEWTVVSTEVEALQLEYNWIKEFDPRFNVRYRDDKTYPMLAVSMNEEYPRVFVYRGARKKGVRYFGPYAHAWAIRETVDLLLRVFPMRTCSAGVFKRHSQIGRPCLLGYIDKCSAPCIDRVSAEEHRRIAEGFCDFLAGKTDRMVRELERRMQAAAAELDFETAARLRDDVQALRRALEKQAVVLGTGTDADVVAFATDDLEAAVQIFHVRDGRVRGQRGWVVDKSGDAVDLVQPGSAQLGAGPGDDEISTASSAAPSVSSGHPAEIERPGGGGVVEAAASTGDDRISTDPGERVESIDGEAGRVSARSGDGRAGEGSDDDVALTGSGAVRPPVSAADQFSVQASASHDDDRDSLGRSIVGDAAGSGDEADASDARESAESGEDAADIEPGDTESAESSGELAALVEQFLMQFYGEQAAFAEQSGGESSGTVVPREVLVPALPGDAEQVQGWLSGLRGSAVQLRVPRRGDKKALMETVQRNAAEALAQHKLKRAGDLTARSAALQGIQEALDLDSAPLRIECVDISHVQGTDVVASLVVFEDGLARKSEYRHYAIKEAAGEGRSDDVASIAEVTRRRFQRLRRDQEVLEAEDNPTPGIDPKTGKPRKFSYPPNLYVVDGGAPQVAAAAEVLEDLGITDVAVIGLAKRLEEVWVPGEVDPVIMPRNSESLYLLQRVRDEAHRFAITFHRSKRSRRMTASALDAVPGLGQARRTALVTHFGSVARLEQATVEEITQVPGIGVATAKAVLAALHGE
ncbi:excinuclease ABC subunit UvrC [Nocardia macrotermitis]|uniref:UvrABC system protein C n=1 Tax=Nocardia macrotermitis TaxID=2585198 RepID=A0A7K0D5K7_9NOCA|nr:excinuclease ABC subunit UvrC [Nocardia macrotermitis]MQY21035.1 UvrABC system protein C [Nocardia macrotermitis]